MALYIETAAAHARTRKRNAAFNGCMHSTPCYSHPSGLEAFLLPENPQTRASSLPVNTMYFSKTSLSFYSPSDKNESLAARAKGRTEHATRAARKNFSVGKERAPLARAAKRGPSPSTPNNSRRVEKRTSIRASLLDLGRSLRSHSHKKKSTRHDHRGYEIMSFVLKSGTAREQ